MKTAASFISGFVIAIAVSAIATETSEVGRYQVSITSLEAPKVDLEATIDTATGEIIKRSYLDYHNYERTRVTK